MLAQMGMPGPIELLILLLVGGLFLGFPLIIVLYLLLSGRFRSSGPAVPCPRCGAWTVPQAHYCHQCGQSLEEPPDDASGP